MFCFSIHERLSRELRQARREQVKTFVLSGDHSPRRARFALDPVPLALGLALASREAGNEVRSGARPLWARLFLNRSCQ